MSGLHLPQSAASILECAYNWDAQTSEFDKWLIYTTEHAPQDAPELYQLAMLAYNNQALNEPESEWPFSSQPIKTIQPSNHPLFSVFSSTICTWSNVSFQNLHAVAGMTSNFMFTASLRWRNLIRNRQGRLQCTMIRIAEDGRLLSVGVSPLSNWVWS